jgi:hypothetical protein
VAVGVAVGDSTGVLVKLGPLVGVSVGEPHEDVICPGKVLQMLEASLDGVLVSPDATKMPLLLGKATGPKTCSVPSYPSIWI